MDKENKSVFERLDEQDSKLDYLVGHISTITAEKDKRRGDESLYKAQQNNINSIDSFLISSTKKHFWFGSNAEFAQTKKWLIRICISLIIIGILSTVITSASVGMYSTFTLFENLWTIAVCFILYYATKAEKLMLDVDLESYSIYIFVQDKYNLWIDNGAQKRKYRWIRWLMYISTIGNIIGILFIYPSNLSVIAVIFELCFLGLSIAISVLVNNLYCQYGHVIYFTGRNQTTGKYVTLVYDNLTKKLMPSEEYEVMYKDIFF